MNKIAIFLVCILGLVSFATANENLVNIKSINSVSKTADNFEKIAKSKGMKIFARIDHAKGAMSVDKDLRPTQVIIFGNPKAGTPLMQKNQTIGLDLPLKVLFWQDENKTTWITYLKPEVLLANHGVKVDKIQNKMTKALMAFSKKASE